MPCLVFKTLPAIPAITDGFTAETAPAVVRKSLRVIGCCNLPENRRNMFTIIGTVDTSNIEIVGSVGFAFCVNGKPVGMGVIKLCMCPVGIHAGKDGKTVFMCYT